jgi:hypothetical protein
MVKPDRVIFQSLVGACAGMTAGVIVVGLWGGLTGIPFILSHAGPKNEPVLKLMRRDRIIGEARPDIPARE